jgi:hypothetical protein
MMRKGAAKAPFLFPDHHLALFIAAVLLFARSQAKTRVPKRQRP